MAESGISRRRFLALTLAGPLLMRAGAALARGAELLILPGGQDDPYREAWQAALSALSNSINVRVLPTLELPAEASGAILLTLGHQAAQLAARQGYPGPVLAALIPRAAYRSVLDELDARTRQRWSGLVLDQPWSRQLGLIQQLFPSAHTVGLLVGPGRGAELDEIRASAQSRGFSLEAVQVTGEQQLFAELRQLLNEVDVMWALPDPEVINRSTVESYLLSAYRARIPVVGYSEALVDAGALAALYSTPAEVGRECAEIVSRWLDNPGHGPLPGRLILPNRFRVKVNASVARSLGLAVPDAVTLQRRLGAGAGP